MRLVAALAVLSWSAHSSLAGVELGTNDAENNFLLGNDLTDPEDDGTLTVTLSTVGGEPGAEPPAAALDNNPTTSKWLNFSPPGTFYQLTFNNDAQHAVNTYTITSGNDAPNRDPYSWTLSGSNDGVNFTVVDEQTAQEFSNRDTTQLFKTGNSQTFNVYRFDFLTEFGATGANADNSIQINEIELFDLADPEVLTLQVDLDTGGLAIVNGSGADIDLQSYRITSESGSLSATNWTSLQSQDAAGFPAGDGTGNGWEAGPNANANELVEWYLKGTSTLASGNSLELGESFAGPAEGDFDDNGVVNGDDFLFWQREFGGSLGPEDLPVWEANFGSSSGGQQDLVFRYSEGNGHYVFGFVEYVGGGAAAAAPEPSSLALAALLLGLAATIQVRRHPMGLGGDMFNRTLKYGSVLLAMFMLAALSGTLAASTPDRDYQFGDDDLENGADGDVVGSNNDASVPMDVTLDSQGPTGAFIDLSQIGAPVYFDAAAAGRPFAEAGEVGIQFDGTSQYLNGIGLGNPGDASNDSLPIQYDGLFQRTIQGYANPTRAGSEMRQDVFFDTAQFGVFIDESDNWGVEYGSPGTLATDIPVEFNEWTHVMHRTTGSVVVLYLDGVASFLRGGFYNTNPGGADGEMWVATAVGGGANFFEGQLDDFQVLVSGDNSDVAGGADWGAFNLGLDNDFVRETLAAEGFVEGDVNGDGVVSGDGLGDPASDDVAFFVDHWLDQQVVDGFVIGDLVTRTEMADLNFSGTTNLFDWAILRQNHADGANLDLAALLSVESVPEPSSVALLATALALGACRLRSRRFAKSAS